MDGEQVQILEEELEVAIARVVRRLAKAKQIKSLPPARIFHLMAKAAVAVLEAVAEENPPITRIQTLPNCV
ncbi:MAG: hypothetical protein ACLP9L_07345 [Thermoguttaceae bacterium]